MKKRKDSFFPGREILRIIDVNLNRVREGLRVCEEVLRFILKDGNGTKRLKELRHSVYKIMAAAKVKPLMLCENRNIKTDVGIDFFALETKKDWQAIFFANMQRAKESLRVLEEFFKLFDNSTGEKFKRLRFDVYNTEKELITRSTALSDIKYYAASTHIR